MIALMLLAHLFGDYILQWDGLAAWKSRSVRGVAVHGLVVAAVALILSWTQAPAWWPWAALIGLSHGAIDAVQPWLNKRWPPAAPGLYGLARLVLDQILHLMIIVLVLVWSGYVHWLSLPATLLDELRGNHGLAMLLGYALMAMPAWVMIEFIVYGLVAGAAPDLTQSWGRRNKYLGTLERWLIAASVLVGQIGLAPLIVLPRLAMESRQAASAGRLRICVTEALASVVVAVAVGLGLSYLLMDKASAPALFALPWRF